MKQRFTTLNHSWHQVAVNTEVGNAKALLAGLAGTQDVAWSANLQILFSQVEAVLAFPHGIQAAFGGFAQTFVE